MLHLVSLTFNIQVLPRRTHTHVTHVICINFLKEKWISIHKGLPFRTCAAILDNLTYRTTIDTALLPLVRRHAIGLHLFVSRRNARVRLCCYGDTTGRPPDGTKLEPPQRAPIADATRTLFGVTESVYATNVTPLPGERKLKTQTLQPREILSARLENLAGPRQRIETS